VLEENVGDESEGDADGSHQDVCFRRFNEPKKCPLPCCTWTSADTHGSQCGHEDVCDGEVQYEAVGHGSHATLGGDGADHERVAADRDDDDRHVDADQQHPRVHRKQVRAHDRRVTVRRLE